MLAVLTDVINILGASRVSPTHRKRMSFNEASSWVFASGIESPLSFDDVCDALGVNAKSLRRRLSKLVSQKGGTSLRIRRKEGTRKRRVIVDRIRRVKRQAH